MRLQCPVSAAMVIVVHILEGEVACATPLPCCFITLFLHRIGATFCTGSRKTRYVFPQCIAPAGSSLEYIPQHCRKGPSRQSKLQNARLCNHDHKEFLDAGIASFLKNRQSDNVQTFLCTSQLGVKTVAYAAAASAFLALALAFRALRCRGGLVAAHLFTALLWVPTVVPFCTAANQCSSAWYTKLAAH